MYIKYHIEGIIMATVTARELKESASSVLSRAQYGNERIIVSRHGKEIAAVVPIEDAHFLEQIEDFLDIKDALAAIEETNHKGSMSLKELRNELGL